MKRCVVCGKTSRKKLCGWHLGNHNPVPEHHVAAERSCLRCGNDFDSTWSGDRVCPRCRGLKERAEREGRWQESPLEPLYTPAADDLIAV